MQTEKYTLSPPSLEELASALRAPLSSNFEHATVDVVQCADLRDAPFHLATEGLSGNERIADVGGQPNLFPTPRLDTIWSMKEIAKAMEMDYSKGSLIGAGAGPFHQVGRNCELVPNFSWEGGMENINNQSYIAQIAGGTGAPGVQKSPSLDCALMINLYGSSGNPGPVLKITARKRKGAEKSFTECIRKALNTAFGESRTVSLGGAFLVKSGRARYHIMPDFPPADDLPFSSAKQLNDWLTYHDFDGPVVCLSVLHSADPDKKMGLRMEHSHGFSATKADAGGHYHYDMDGHNEDIEYEGYFNVANFIYRIAKPEVTLERDLHD
ncbi:DUF1907-domain-containing protein [Aaosphaeria arxii CBS 175.79]|uniref:DUF1907-domain-containing protein n=1 Tax=Aaosphaeria arxii CBS 175.79 TaxID=1450172 RepID=A0A6A5Y0V6_9PLEO|nr:DUF1907-domain-containing protein [Aaosphaeria arxii CBS 175.79]KAF2018430.1 DUF1907-domain-containing protein [Aaosphaeria arxii CBS 175.79]